MMLTVTVNDRPLNVAAVVERGRVLLPMRATFSALGASVGYNPRGNVIVARSAAHSLRLRIGSGEAVVDGRRVRLDVPARIIATRTYVPLRFVAQAMGAVVGYDARANLVNVTSRELLTSNAPATHKANVVGLTPAPQANVGTAYPTISASLGMANASRSDVTLTVDGEDVTGLASFDGATITYMPRVGLNLGTHTVNFSGRTLAGVPFSASWSFLTSQHAAPDAPAFAQYDYRFYVSGPQYYYRGDWMHFVLIAPPGGSAELSLCDMGFQYALWNTGYGSVYEANFPVPNNYWMPSCAVTAVYTAWNGQRYYVPIPVIIGIFTGPQPGSTPHPKSTPSPRPIPPGPRHPEPTPTPTSKPTPKPTPKPTNKPVPKPLPTRFPLPHVSPPSAPPAHTPAPQPPAVHTSPPELRRTPHPHPVPRFTPAVTF